MSALGRYILASTLFLCGTLLLIGAVITRSDAGVILGFVGLATYVGAFKALISAQIAEITEKQSKQD